MCVCALDKVNRDPQVHISHPRWMTLHSKTDRQQIDCLSVSFRVKGHSPRVPDMVKVRVRRAQLAKCAVRLVKHAARLVKHAVW